MRRTIVLLVFIVTVTGGTARLLADESANAFRASLLHALTANDAGAVHAMIAFPLRVTLPGGHSMTLRDAVTLSGPAYTAIFTPDTLCAIERGAVSDAGETVTIGRVAVARRAGGALKLTELRVIGAAAESNRPVRGTLDLRFKGATRQAAGNLANAEVDTYTVSATRGVVLQAKLERFKGLDAVLRVTDSNGHPVDAKSDGKRVWSAPIPASGTYRLDVVRKAPFCDPPLTYLLTVTAK